MNERLKIATECTLLTTPRSRSRGGFFIVMTASSIIFSASCTTRQTQNVPPQPLPASTPKQETQSKTSSEESQNTVTASHYGEGDGFKGKKTASGEAFNPNALTAAHKTLPMGTKLEVKNPKTGKSVEVRVNDRGPHVKGRTLDLSSGAAKQIGLDKQGVGKVEMKVIEEPQKSQTPAAK